MNIDEYIFSDDDDPQDLPIEGQEPPEDISLKDDNDDSDDSGTVSVDDDAVSYFEYLKVNNLLDVDEDFVFDGTPEKVQEAMEITKNKLTGKVAETIWNQLPDDFKPLLEYGLNGGKSLSDYLNAYTPVDYSDADLDDPISQKQIIKDYYKAINPNYKEDKIDRMVSTLEKMDDTSLKEEAIEAIEYLKELRQTQQNELIQSAKDAEKQRLAKAEEQATKLSTLIDSSKHDSLRKNRIKNVLFQPIKKGDNTTTEFNHALNSILQTPEHLLQLADLLADYDSRVGFNFGRLIKQLETKSTKNFKELMQSKLDTKANVKGNPMKSQKDDFDLSK